MTKCDILKSSKMPQRYDAADDKKEMKITIYKRKNKHIIIITNK